MKVSVLKSEVSVPRHLKMFALILSLLDSTYHGERERIIRNVAHYYGVTL